MDNARLTFIFVIVANDSSNITAICVCFTMFHVKLNEYMYAHAALYYAIETILLLCIWDVHIVV